jgi:hypothetical protein
MHTKMHDPGRATNTLFIVAPGQIIPLPTMRRLTKYIVRHQEKNTSVWIGEINFLTIVQLRLDSCAACDHECLHAQLTHFHRRRVVSKDTVATWSESRGNGTRARRPSQLWRQGQAHRAQLATPHWTAFMLNTRPRQTNEFGRVEERVCFRESRVPDGVVAECPKASSNARRRCSRSARSPPCPKKPEGAPRATPRSQWIQAGKGVFKTTTRAKQHTATAIAPRMCCA